jgi:hypothetical protein
MAIKKSLSSYKFSDKPKTDRQANVEQNNDLKKVIDINAYNKQLKELKAAGMEGDEAKSEAAKKAWRSINLKTVLGFMAGGKFYDLRDENEIQSNFGDDVYNSLTSSMKNALSQSQQASESFDFDIAEGDWGWDDPQYDDPEPDADPDWEYDKARQDKIDQDDSDTEMVYRVYDSATKQFVGDQFDSQEDAAEFRNSLPGNDNMTITPAKIVKKENVEPTENNDELQRIKSLSGIGQGIGF